MYTLRYSGHFKRSYKLCKKRGYDMSKLEIVLRLLSETVLCRPNINRINYQVVVWRGIGNVILSLIGCWYGIKMIQN